MSPPEDLDRLSHAALKELVVRQWEQIVELRRMVAALRDEIARLKGGPGRPNIKPSGMEQATEPKPAGSSGNRGSTRSKLLIHEERTLNVAAPPRGSRFAGNIKRWGSDEFVLRVNLLLALTVRLFLMAGIAVVAFVACAVLQ